jgi:hypothetical protein
MSFEMVDAPRKTLVRWRRVHLPRLTDWPLALDLPAGSIVLPSPMSDQPEVFGFRPLPLERHEGLAWPVLLVAALVLLKRRFIEARFGRAHLVLSFGWPYVLAGAALLVLGAQLFAPTWPFWAAPLLFLLWHRPPQAATNDGRVSSTAMGADTRPNAMSALDATTPAGASFAALVGTALLALDQPSAALLLAPVFLLGTRLHRPPSPTESTRILLDFVARLRVPAEAPPMSFRWDRVEDGSPCVHVMLPGARVGTRSLRFVVASSPYGHARKRDVRLLVETRAQSDADDLMRRRTGASARPVCVAECNVRLVQWDAEALGLLRALASQRPSPAKASRGTWLLREISEPRRRAA